jgi:hypothetical protein
MLHPSLAQACKIISEGSPSGIPVRNSNQNLNAESGTTSFVSLSGPCEVCVFTV